MRFLVCIAFLLFSLTLAAKKAPEWKAGNFKASSSGLQYKIVKTGKGDSVRPDDIVEADFFPYKKDGSKCYKDTEGNKAGNFEMDDANLPAGIKEAMKLLKKGGKGYFILPPSIGSGKDSILCFIRVKKIIHMRHDTFVIKQDTIPADSVNIVINDPGKKYFGDSLFSVMKLVEKPQIVSCGASKVMIAFKFEISYFEEGMKHKNILVFIDCPDSYGENYFVAGGSYVVTCVPLLDDLKEGSRTMNSYSLEKFDRYYGLRVKKM